MIAKIKVSGSPHALIDYLLQDKKEGMNNRAVHIGSQYCGTTANEIKRDWDRSVETNKRLTKTAMHLIFSLPEGENLSDRQWADFVQSTVSDKMGLKDFSWVAVKHLDTDDRHPHLHVAVCRVSPLTGKTLSDSQTYKKGMQICREAERKYNLKRINNPWEKQSQRYDSRKAVMHFKIEMAAKQATNLQGFMHLLEKQGIKVIKGRGIAYVDDKGMYVKGSDRQIGFTLNRLDHIFRKNTQEKKQVDSINTIFQPGMNFPGKRQNTPIINLPKSDLSGSLDKLFNVMNYPIYPMDINAGAAPEPKRKKRKKKKRGLRR